MRQLDSSVLNELANTDDHDIAHLVNFSLINPEGTVQDVYVTDYYTDIDVGNKTYVALGRLLGISPVQTDSDIKVQDIRLSLTGVDSVYFSSVLSYYYTDRKVEIYTAFMQDGEVIGDAIKIFEGRLDSPTISDNPDVGESVVQITASNYLSDFDRKIGRYTNDTQQRSFYPNDDFFSLWGKIEKDTIWGKED
jgi:hypothetical protein